MLKRSVSFLLVSLAVLGCTPEPTSERGFRLPEGDVAAGKATFEELNCVVCHSVEGIEFANVPAKRSLEIRLGGKVLRVRTYGELVTAIIHPSREIASSYPVESVSRAGESLMIDYNEVMTVKQLIDLVAFLQSAYEEYLPRDYDPYFP